MTTRYDRIRDMLTMRFTPVTLEIEDESAKHAGHAHLTGVPAGGETHYRLVLVSHAFAGQSRVERSRAVNEALKAEFNTGLHALSLKLKTPDEVDL